MMMRTRTLKKRKNQIQMKTTMMMKTMKKTKILRKKMKNLEQQLYLDQRYGTKRTLQLISFHKIITMKKTFMMTKKKMMMKMMTMRMIWLDHL